MITFRITGVHMWDNEGKKYLDFLGGFATLNQGHCHPKILKTLHEQSSILHHTSRAIYHDLLYQLGEYLTNLFRYKKFIPMNTGEFRPVHNRPGSGVWTTVLWNIMGRAVCKYIFFFCLVEYKPGGVDFTNGWSSHTIIIYVFLFDQVQLAIAQICT